MADEPEGVEAPQVAPLIVGCPECGELIEVHDVAALVRALHLQNSCEAMESGLASR